MAKLHELRQAQAKAEDELKSLANAMIDAAEKSESDEDESLVAADKAHEDKVKEIDEIKAQIKRIEEAERKAADSAVPARSPEGTLAPAQPRNTQADAEEIKMVPVRRMMADMIVANSGGRIDPEEWLVKAYGETTANIVKATHQLTDYGTGGALSLPDFAQTIIEGLENMTVVRRMNPQVLNVPGTLVLPREVSAPDGAWAGENTAPTPGTFAFGDIRLDPKRLPIEVVISRRLLDMAARGGAAVRNLESYIVRRLRERLAVNEDAGFLRGAGTEFVPQGIRNQIAAANVKAIAGTTAANIETDLRSRVTVLQENNIMITDGYWIMPPRTRAYLADLRDSNGNKIYPSIDAKNELLGHPILMTNQVPINLDGSNTEIMFGNGPSVIVANGSDAEVRVSTEGSYQSGGTHYSLIQRNEMLIHMEMYADVKLERDTAFSALTAVSY